MTQMIRYKGQLYKRIDSNENEQMIRYLKTNAEAKKAVLKFVKDAEGKKKGEQYVKALENAIKDAENGKIHEAKRALEDAIKHSTNSQDTFALKSVIQKLK